MKDLNLIYENIIFEQNTCILCEEINYLAKQLNSNLISEANFLETIKNLFSKIGFLFSSLTEAFQKGYKFTVNFCKYIFQTAFIPQILKLLGISKEFLLELTQIAKASLVVFPVVKIGMNVISKTQQEIREEDVQIFINRQTFNEKSEKLFSQRTLLEKIGTILKTGSKALIAELCASFPLILKCVTGYAIASGFEAAVNDPHFLAVKLEETKAEMKNARTSLEKAKAEDGILTAEEALTKINENITDSGPMKSMAKAIVRGETAIDTPDGGKDNLQALYNRETNQGAPDLVSGTRTTFNGNEGKFKTEKLSEAEGFVEAIRQMTGEGVPGFQF